MSPSDEPTESSGRTPRYVSIKNDLLDRMRSGNLKPGDKTESENALAARFDVSRLTVQRAIRELVAEGRLNRVQGSGTFVARKPSGFSLFEVRDLGEQVLAQGGDPQVDVLIQRQYVPDETVRELMELEEEEPVFEAVLVRRNGKMPVAIEDRYARRDVFPDFLEHDFALESIYDYLASTVQLGTLETHLNAIIPDALTAQRLHIEQDDPCLFLERLNTVNGKVVTLSRFTFAGARLGLSSVYNAS